MFSKVLLSNESGMIRYMTIWPIKLVFIISSAYDICFGLTLNVALVQIPKDYLCQASKCTQPHRDASSAQPLVWITAFASLLQICLLVSLPNYLKDWFIKTFQLILPSLCIEILESHLLYCTCTFYKSYFVIQV